MSDRARADKIVQDHVLWSIGAGLVPLPILDIVAVTAIQLDMLRQLARLHGVNFSESEGKAWVSALAGNMVARLGANALKLIPGIGSVIGGLSMSIISGASTYALGQVAKQYYAAGRKIDTAELKRTFTSLLEEAKVRKDQYTKQIQEKVNEVKNSNLVSLIKEQ